MTTHWIKYFSYLYTLSNDFPSVITTITFVAFLRDGLRNTWRHKYRRALPVLVPERAYGTALLNLLNKAPLFVYLLKPKNFLGLVPYNTRATLVSLRETLKEMVMSRMKLTSLLKLPTP